MHNKISEILDAKIGMPISSEDIVDIMNLIGVCVVAGNVRRTAEIALGEITDKSYIDLKLDQDKLISHRWASNNSVLAKKGMDYSEIIERVVTNGEPGFVWLDNIQAYGRMKDGKNFKDYRALGTNPCFAPETLITTREGLYPIKDLVGKSVEVLSNNEWVTVDNFRITGKNKNILKITMQDGSTLRVTPEHKMILSDGTRVEAT